MSDHPVTRGDFLRSFGKSMTGMALGTGVGLAAQALAKRVAARLPEEMTASSATTIEERKMLSAENPFIESGPTDGNRIALTFDDGPTPGVTERILDELKQRDLHATFFMIGQRVDAEPELARRVLAEGHEIGNHTFTHTKLNTLPDRKAAAEIEKTQETLNALLNYRANWFRPPCGALRRNQAAIPQSKGLGTVFWSVDSGDWAQPGEDKIAEAILTKIHPGSIILCHDLYPQTASCVGEVLKQLLKRNFNFVTVSSLLGQPSNGASHASVP